MRPRHNNQFRRIVQLAGQNLNRNLYISITTTLMMGLILFIFNVIWSLNLLAQNSLQELESKVDLIVYINDSSSVYDVTEIQNTLYTIPEVLEVQYTSKDEALNSFLEQYPEKSALFTKYDLQNPLPANFKIVTQSPEHHETVIDYLNNSPYESLLMEVESAQENQAIVDRLIGVREFTQKLIVGVILAFVIGSLFMIMNAVHLSIFTRKKEIQIMQLVGAHPNMIRYPFLIEGALYSILAVFFSFILVFIFATGTNLTSFLNLSNGLAPLGFLALELAASLTVGVLSSLFAINFYLKRTFALDQ